MSNRRPNATWHNGFARSRDEAEYPQLWPSFNWSPCLGPTGGALKDIASGKQNHGTLTGMTLDAAWTTSEGRTALLFDGSNDRVDIPDITSFSAVQQTWSTWVNFDTLAANETWLMKGTYSSDWSYGFQTSALGALLLFVTDSVSDAGVNYGTTGTGVVASDAWYHIVVVYNAHGSDNASRLQLYVSGINVTLTFVGTINATGLVDSVSPLRIGEFTGLGRNLAGKIAEVTIYDLAMTAAAVQSLFSLGPGGWATLRQRRVARAPATGKVPWHLFGMAN